MENQASTTLGPTASDASEKSFAPVGPSSPTWSSKSSMCGSTGTGMTSRQSQSSCRLSGYSDNVSHIAAMAQGNMAAVARAGASAESAGAQVSETMSYDAFNDSMNTNNISNFPLPNIDMDVQSAAVTSGEVLLQAAPAMDVTGQALRPPVFMTPMQIQMHQQLKAKHAELFKKIIEQQEELRKVSEQLLMTQYGLVPVSMAPISSLQNSNEQVIQDQSQNASNFANVAEMNWQNNLQSQQGQNAGQPGPAPVVTTNNAPVNMPLNQLQASVSLGQRNFAQPQQMQQQPQQR